MKQLIAVILFCVSFPTSTLADDVGYTLEVKGMFCAYCAYNVSKQLKNLDGVIPESVDVDLENDVVTLQSEKPLVKNQLAELVQSAGFQLGTVTETVFDAQGSRPRPGGPVVMRLTFDANQLADGKFNVMLEALGTLAAQRSAQIAIEAPAELEVPILRPVLGGRKTVIDVIYRPVSQPTSTVLINLLSY